MSSSSYKGKSAGSKPADFYAFLCLGHIAAAVDGNDFVEAAAYTVAVGAVFGDGGCDLVFLGDREIGGFALEYPVVNMAGVFTLIPGDLAFFYLDTCYCGGLGFGVIGGQHGDGAARYGDLDGAVAGAEQAQTDQEGQNTHQKKGAGELVFHD